MRVIRKQYEYESLRYEDELNSQRNKQKRELRAKLDLRINKRSKEIEGAVRQSGDEITTLEARALAEEEMSEALVRTRRAD